ncbi:hypothetical protein LJC56_09770, partial [Christensenellaceae bacterium OttesenSCG-928-K19]|nr:hypothetical protein [Christensenellaceae bacterium OttesenSCG-928-K19]
MAKRHKKTVCLLLALLWAVLLPCAALAEEPPPEDVVHTEQALRDWLDAHAGAGGTVTLGDTITLTMPYYISGGEDAHITIDTGDFGLVYQTGGISGDYFSIVGNGVDTPVLSITGACVFRGSYMNILLDADVTALGKDGVGGTAVSINHVDTAYTFQPSSVYSSTGSIRAVGAGAVGVRVESAQALYFLNVSVEGENALAVFAPAGSTLYFCHLTAAGAGAAAAPDTIALDTCTANPAPAGLMQRKIIGPSLHVGLVQGAAQYEVNSLADYLPTLLLGADGQENLALQASAVWDAAALASIDTGVLGKTTVPGTLCPALQGFGLADDFALELCVEIMDPALPYIQSIALYEDGEGYCLELGSRNILDADDLPLLGTAILTSLDGGETWEDITDSPLVSYSWGMINIQMPTVPPLSLYRAEVDGVSSNIVEVYAALGAPVGGNGGDRTGVDRPGGDTDPPGNDPDPPGDDPDPPGNDVDPPGNTPDPPGGGTDPPGAPDPPDDNPDPPGGTDPPGNDPDPPGGGTNPPGATDPPGGTDASASTDTPGQDTAQPTPSQKDQAGTEEARPGNSTAAREEDESASKDSLPVEWSDDTTSVLSGVRINLLAAANPEVVTFIKPGVRVEVSSRALLALELADHQTFTLKVVWQDDGTAEANFLVEGAPVTLEHRVILDETSAGTQTSMQDTLPLDEEESNRPEFIAAAVLSSCAVLGGGGAVFWRRNRHKARRGKRK